MRLIKITFDSAKLIIDPKKDSDKIIELSYNKKGFCNISRDRYDDEYVDFNTIIKWECVSNMLHVLIGDRPVSSNRKTLYNRVNEIDDIVKNGYYKINNVFTYTDKNGTVRPQTEFTQGKKIQHNSHAKDLYTKCDGKYVKGNITWSILKRKFLTTDPDKYETIVNNLKKWCNDDNIVDNHTIVEALIMLRDSKYKDEAIEFFKEIKITPFVNVIENNIDKIDFSSLNSFKCKLATRIVNQYPNFKISINGEFIFNVDDDMYLKLIKGQHLATFLDGGVAELQMESFDFDENSYTKIC